MLRKLTSNLAISNIDEIKALFVNDVGEINYMDFIYRIESEMSTKFQQLEQTSVLSEFLDQAQISQEQKALAQLTFRDLIQFDREIGIVWKELFKTIDHLGTGVVHHSKVESIFLTNGIPLRIEAINLLKRIFVKN